MGRAAGDRQVERITKTRNRKKDKRKRRITTEKGKGDKLKHER